jgi:hypothetical protein
MASFALRTGPCDASAPWHRRARATERNRQGSARVFGCAKRGRSSVVLLAFVAPCSPADRSATPRSMLPNASHSNPTTPPSQQEPARPRPSLPAPSSAAAWSSGTSLAADPLARAPRAPIRERRRFAGVRNDRHAPFRRIITTLRASPPRSGGPPTLPARPRRRRSLTHTPSLPAQKLHTKNQPTAPRTATRRTSTSPASRPSSAPPRTRAPPSPRSPASRRACSR